MQDRRFLRSPKLRFMLLKHQGGKCAICGADITRGFHADHIVPWKISKTTNVHGMQALCGPCNFRKGANEA